MRKIRSSAIISLVLIAIAPSWAIAAGKPAVLPTPTAQASAEAKGNSNSSNSSSNSGAKTNNGASDTKPSSDAKPGNSGNANPNNPSPSNGAIPNENSNRPASGNSASNASDRAKEKANENSAVSKSNSDTGTSTVDSGPTKRYIIRYNDNSPLTIELKSLAEKKIKVDRTISRVFKGAVANLSERQVEALKKNPNLADLELDATVRTTELQPTTSWGLDRIDQRALPLDLGFSYISNGSNTKIYVVDTGIRSTHTEFTGRVQGGYSAISDGQGTNDCNGHGTHVSGIAAGATTGVAKNSTLIPVRVLDCTGSGSISGVIAGLDWIANNYISGSSAVVNMSLGGGASSTLDSAVSNLISRGITVVVAAGNSTADACLSSPSRVPGAITVAASTISDGFASYSNFGICVDLIAPGTSIYSSWLTSDSAYTTLSGTSMATPYVAGYAAALLSTGYQTASGIAQVLSNSATQGVITNVSSATANRLLFTGAAQVTPPPPTSTAPGAPTNLQAVAQKRSASLSWTAAPDKGSPLTSQSLKIYAGSSLVATKAIAATATSLTVSGLKTNTTYTFTVTAINAIGPGPESVQSNPVKPFR